MDGRNTGRMGFSHAAEDSAENMMAAVKAGKIRKHLMGNTSPIRYGTMEKREMTEYTDTNYDGLLEEFSEEVIQSRYAVFYEEIEEFAKSLGIREKIQISESLLSHAVLDYFTDISRLKHFHQAKHINSLKVISYETYWLLRRKPIQILVEDETSDAMAFLNEKFVFSRIAKYLMGDGKRVILSPETKKGFLNYLDSLFYYLKYRNYDAEMLEMMLMGFKAGVLVADDLKEQES